MAKKQQRPENGTEKRSQCLKDGSHKKMSRLKEKGIQEKKQQQTEKVSTELEITTQ